jgi:hypothetical protein
MKKPPKVFALPGALANHKRQLSRTSSNVKPQSSRQKKDRAKLPGLLLPPPPRARF